VAHVRPPGFGNWVVVDVDDAVEVIGDDFGDVVEFLKVVLAIDDEGGQGK